MAFEQLAPDDQEYIRQCVAFVAATVDEPHDEIRYDFTVEQVRAFSANWPNFDDTQEDSLTTVILNNCMSAVLHGWGIDPLEWNRNFTVTPERVELSFDRWQKLKGYKSLREDRIELVIAAIEHALAADDKRQATRARTEASDRDVIREDANWRWTLHGVQYSLMHLYRHNDFCMGAERISSDIASIFALETDSKATSPFNALRKQGFQKLFNETEDGKLRLALKQLLNLIETYDALPIEAPERGCVRARLSLYEALVTALRLQALPLGEWFE